MPKLPYYKQKKKNFNIKLRKLRHFKKLMRRNMILNEKIQEYLNLNKHNIKNDEVLKTKT